MLSSALVFGCINRKRKEVKPMEILNFGLLKHPLNWATVFLMVLLFGIGLHLILDFYGAEPGSADKN